MTLIDSIRLVEESELDTLPPGLYRLAGEKNLRIWDVLTNDMYDGPGFRIARVVDGLPEGDAFSVLASLDVTFRPDRKVIVKQWVSLRGFPCPA